MKLENISITQAHAAVPSGGYQSVMQKQEKPTKP